MRSKRTYLVTLRQAEEGGFTVEVPALPGCVSQGETYEEALTNIRQAITAYLEELEEGELNPEAPVLITTVEVEVPRAATTAHARSDANRLLQDA